MTRVLAMALVAALLAPAAATAGSRGKTGARSATRTVRRSRVRPRVRPPVKRRRKPLQRAMRRRDHVVRATTPRRIAERLAADIVRQSAASIREHGSFHIVLSGGQTPRELFRVLRSPRFRKQIDFSRWRVFFADERAVPVDHQASNYRMTREELLGSVPIPPEHVHRIPVELGSDRAARAYGLRVAAHRLDLALLGMGGDGHIASLFPGANAPPRGQQAAAVEGADHPRVTLTLDAIHRASRIAVLVTGENKAARVAEVLAGGSSVPAGQLKGGVQWYLDQAAAGQLEK